MRRGLVVGAAVVAVVAVGLVRRRSDSGRADAESERRGRAAVAVETAPVMRETVRDTGRFSGSLRARSTFAVAARIGGRLEWLGVDLGDTVERGQLIARLDSEEYEQQVRQAEAELEVAVANRRDAESALVTVRRERDRVAELFERDIASEAEADAVAARVDAAEARAEIAAAQVRQREAGLEAARIRLSYTRIHAIWEGGAGTRVVGERHVYEGAMLRPNDPIATLLETRNLTAAVHVIERDVPRVAVGQPVRIFTDAWPGEAFAGTVARVAPLVREASRQAPVEIEAPNPDGRLRPGLFIRAEIVFDVVEDACVIPAAALVRRNGQSGVFQAVPEEDVARFVPVTPGVEYAGRVQIREPRLEGEVVTLGQHLLADGAPIRRAELPPGDAPAAAPAPRSGRP